MRPRKTVLLVCDTIERDEELRFMLTLKGFHVLALSRHCRPDVAMVVQSLDGPQDDAYAATIIESVSFYRDSPILFLKETSRDASSDLRVHAFFVKGVSAMEIVERLRVLTRRKRGRKKVESVAA